MLELLKPSRGGFLRPFGCGWFIREYLAGNSPGGSPPVDPATGAPQADIFYHYKTALRQATAMDRAVRAEERRAEKEKRPIDPDRIDALAGRYLVRLPYKTSSCRYHSFVVYFSTLRRLEWVEPSGYEEPSAFQGNYPPGPSRIYYRLTQAGRAAGDGEWSNPHLALYGKGNPNIV